MPEAKVIQVSLDHHLHNGWSMDHQAFPPVDLLLEGTPDAVVSESGARHGYRRAGVHRERVAGGPDAARRGIISVGRLAHDLRVAVGDDKVSLLHLPLAWNAPTGRSAPAGLHRPGRRRGPWRRSGDRRGCGSGAARNRPAADRGGGRRRLSDGGHRAVDGGTLPHSADGDRGEQPLALNDELHQERVARARNRPVENKWIGQRLSDPDIDLAAMGQAQGAIGFGPVEDAADLPDVLAEAVAALRAGRRGGGCAGGARLRAGDDGGDRRQVRGQRAA